MVCYERKKCFYSTNTLTIPYSARASWCEIQKRMKRLSIAKECLVKGLDKPTSTIWEHRSRHEVHVRAQSAGPVRLKWWRKVSHRIYIKPEVGAWLISGRQNSMSKGRLAWQRVMFWRNPQQLSTPGVQSGKGESEIGRGRQGPGQRH